MSACCHRDCDAHRAHVMVSVPSYQQDACWVHIHHACQLIARTTGYVGPFTLTPLDPERPLAI